MAKLTAAARKRLKKSSFALPGKKTRKNPTGKGGYPVEDRKHASVAKGYAKQNLDKGRISKATYDRIVAKANKELGKGGSKSSRKYSSTEKSMIKSIQKKGR